MITGGAGFIGSHLADELLARGYKVRALDNLAAQVHGDECDAADRISIRRWSSSSAMFAMRIPFVARFTGIDAVYHFAAAVGVGQSMYEIEHYTD